MDRTFLGRHIHGGLRLEPLETRRLKAADLAALFPTAAGNSPIVSVAPTIPRPEINVGPIHILQNFGTNTGDISTINWGIGDNDGGISENFWPATHPWNFESTPKPNDRSFAATDAALANFALADWYV